MTSAYTPDLPAAQEEPPASGGLDRGLAMFGYLCLFFTVFFAGVPAFVAVVLAYARQDDADPVSRSHLRFQISVFWWAFGLTVLSAIAMIAAIVVGVASFGELTRAATQVVEGGDLAVGASAGWGLLLASIVLFCLATLWTWLAPLWGGIKLAAGKSIGRRSSGSDAAS